MKYQLIALSFLLALVSCGKDGDGNKSESVTSLVSTDLSGNYKALLRPLNTQANGFLPSGGAEVKANETELLVKTYLDDDTKVTHIQDIREGTRCPTQADDANGDGFIDVTEAAAVVGPVMIALDGDLDSHEGGQTDYPRGGSFTYTRQAKMDNVIKEAQALRRGVFQFEGKVVLIHGTSDLLKVPATVATINDLPRNLTLPIACGILKRK